MRTPSLWRTGAGENLPNGIDPSDYPKSEKWSHRKWAWEFLRRNPYFIAECKKVENGTATEESVCATFNLQEFKHYSKKYKAETSPLPVFPLNRRRFAANVTAEGIRTRRKARVRLKPGEVVFVFDLNHDRQVAGGLDYQIDVVTKRLHELKDAYFTSNEYATAKNTKPQSQSFIRSLRLLDATREHESIAAGYKAAFPEMCRNLSLDAIRRKAESDLRAARAYALKGYVQIAARKGASNS
jgi:hypothetical protein